MSSYVAKFVKKIKSQTKAQFFYPKDTVSISGFFSTLKLECDKIRIHEGAAKWVLPQFVKDTVASALSSHTGAEDLTAPLTAIMRYNKVRPSIMLHSYPQAAKNLLKKYATDAATAEYSAAILHYMQPASMILQ